jgi:hypothetical protein
MKFIGFTIVNNGQDILDQFVRHNLRVLNELCMIDHVSTDRTMPILQALAQTRA